MISKNIPSKHMAQVESTLQHLLREAPSADIAIGKLLNLLNVDNSAMGKLLDFIGIMMHVSANTAGNNESLSDIVKKSIILRAHKLASDRGEMSQYPNPGAINNNAIRYDKIVSMGLNNNLVIRSTAPHTNSWSQPQNGWGQPQPQQNGWNQNNNNINSNSRHVRGW